MEETLKRQNSLSECEESSKILKKKRKQLSKQIIIFKEKNKQLKSSHKNKIISDEDEDENNEENQSSPINQENNQIIQINDITEKLSNSTIYCRDSEREFIEKFITQQSILKTLFIAGQPGTGKTSLVLDIFKSPLLNTKEYFLKISINCISLSSIEEFYKQLFAFFNHEKNYEYFKKNYSQIYDKIIAILKQPSSNKAFLKLLSFLKSSTILLLLDEIDFFYQKNNEMLFFDIMNIPYLINGDMKMILISNNSDFDTEIFPKLLNRKIKIEKIIFKPYSHMELTNIMKKKLEEIKMIQYFSPESIRFLSSKMNKNGDLRPVIDITKSLILRYKEDFGGNNKKIEMKDMFEVLKTKNIHLSEIINGMTTEQKIIVVAIYYAMKQEKGEIDLEEKDIHDKYKMIKKKSNSHQLAIEEFREVLKSFCELGLIASKVFRAKSKSKGKGNNVFRVQYSDEDIEIIFADSNMYKMFIRHDDIEEIEEEEEVNEEF